MNEKNLSEIDKKRTEIIHLKNNVIDKLKKAKEIGGDSIALSDDTEKNRLKLEKERKAALEEKERQILMQTKELKRMQKNATAGDSKALDADTEAARRKLMKQRAEEKRAREQEIIAVSYTHLPLPTIYSV